MRLRRDLLEEVARRQLDCGAWAALRSSEQPALEPTCLATLAAKVGSEVRERGQHFLLRVQNPNGSWSALVGDDQEGAWVTSLAIMALSDCPAAMSSRLRGYAWLVQFSGKEANWFWKWKFRTVDREVRFDPDQYGWPWFPDTVSWVVPTSFSMLALNQALRTCSVLEHISARLERGTKMLLDRVCPLGGWNAGNGVVYGASLPPHPDDTAVALLALTAQKPHSVVRRSVRYLQEVAFTLRAPSSLAWALLALAAHGRPVNSFELRLCALAGLTHIQDTGTLAAVCLALDYRSALSALGIVS